MPDSNFERAFADLAHAALRDKAPKLMNHLVGFQLIDKNDEDTHAVGVFGFKVGGKQWFYAPVFFMNGQLKGSDLLYVKSQDIFVPMQDNWINYLISKQPYEMGTMEPKPEDALGLQAPNFDIFADSPDSGGQKWASVINTRYIQPWAKPFLPVYRAMINENINTKYASVRRAFDVRNFLHKFPEASISLFKGMRKSAALMESVAQFYDLRTLFPSTEKVKLACSRYYRSKRMRKQAYEGLTGHVAAKEREEVPALDNKSEVAVVNLDDVREALGDGSYDVLSEKERSDLLNGEIVVRDTRNKASVVYDADFNKKIFNPTETGVYEIVGRDGQFVKALVIYNPKTIGEGRTNAVVTVVTADRKYGNYRTTDIWARNYDSAELGTRTFDTFESFARDKGVSISSMTPGHKYVMFGPSGQGTIPFRFIRSEGSNDGTARYLVFPDTVVQTTTKHRSGYDEKRPAISLDSDRAFGDYVYDRTTNNARTTEWDGKTVTPYELADSRVIMTTTKRKYGITQNGNTTVVPDSFKVIDLGMDKTVERGYWSDEDRAIPFDPGSFVDIEMGIMKHASALDVFKRGSAYIIASNNKQRTLTKQAALKHLIIDWGMREDDARDIERSANGYKKRYYVKRAGMSSPSFPAYPSSFSDVTQVPMQGPQTDLMPVPGGQPDPYAAEAYDITKDPEVVKALQAAQGGQKDVFDTRVIGGLAKAVDVDSLIDQMLPDMIKGMDRAGRILFMFYWHNDHFKERYGRTDLLDLEDSLRDCFKSLGDLIIFIKQKTIEPQPELAAMDLNLGQPDTE